jgi:hypothetical protein
MPAHEAFALPHGTHAACSHVGDVPGVTVNVVWTPVGNGRISPSAVTHGSGRHEPAVLPQSVSLAHVLNRFAAAFVVQRFSPVAPFSV